VDAFATISNGLPERSSGSKLTALFTDAGTPAVSPSVMRLSPGAGGDITIYWADMAKVVTGQNIGKTLCEVLSLPKHTRSFVLRCEVNKAVSVECEYYPELDVGSLEAALAEFDLVRREVSAPTKAGTVDFDAWLAQRNEDAHAAMMARHAALSRMDEQALAFHGLIRWAHA
jgi:hypothetical protein